MGSVCFFAVTWLIPGLLMVPALVNHVIVIIIQEFRK